MYIEKLDDVVNKYSSIYYRTIKVKPVDVKPSIYFNKENNNEGPSTLKLMIK